jgi:large subunit ribosomal protein L15
MDTTLLKRIHKNIKKVQVGRGGKRGKTAGRGTKGQNARSGRKIRPEIRDMIKRLPKLRGRGKNSNKSIAEKTLPVNVGQLNAAFSNGDEVTRNAIFAKGLIFVANESERRIKILGDGELTKKLIISGCLVSKSAEEKVKKAGGTIKV